MREPVADRKHGAVYIGVSCSVQQQYVQNIMDRFVDQTPNPDPTAAMIISTKLMEKEGWGISI